MSTRALPRARECPSPEAWGSLVPLGRNARTDDVEISKAKAIPCGRTDVSRLMNDKITLG